MQVEVEVRNKSVFIVETSTKGVLCHLPNILVRKDVGAVLKALSIMMKGMSVEAKKRSKQNTTAAKD